MSHYPSFGRIVCVLAAILSSSHRVEGQTLHYRLLPLDVAGDTSEPVALNDRGWVVGWTRFSRADHGKFKAILFKDGEPQLVLPLNLGEASFAEDINNRGDIVGYAYDETQSYAFAKSQGQVTRLPQANLDARYYPRLINERREIVGTFLLPSQSSHIGVGWRVTAGEIESLPVDERFNSTLGMNNFGWIAGRTTGVCNDPFDPASAGLIGHDGTAIQFGDLNCNHRILFGDINDAGEAAGMLTWFDTPGSRAFIAANGALRKTYTSLTDVVQPTAINESGLVVGFASPSSGSSARAFVWQDSEPVFLDDLTTNSVEFDLTHAVDINEVGQIACKYTLAGTGGPFRAALLIPVDLTLSSALPGVAGEISTIFLAGATPGGTVRFFYGLAKGPSAIPECESATLGIADPVYIGTGTVSNTTNAWTEVAIPSSARGQTIFLQAFEPSSCRVSNVVTFTPR